jgi:hypothetical protein
MKNKRLQFKNGGSLNYFKNFDSLNTNLNIQKGSFNLGANKQLPKGFSVGAQLNKFGGKSSTTYNVNKNLGKGFSIGVSKSKKQKPQYGRRKYIFKC